MGLSQIIREDRINLALKASSKEEALQELTELLQISGALADQSAFIKDVMEREGVSTTGIGNGVAIPHGKSKFVNETSIAIGRSREGLEWESFDGEPVTFIVLLAVNETDKTNGHIRLLSQMARKLASESVCQKLKQVQSTEEILEIFSGEPI